MRVLFFALAIAATASAATVEHDAHKAAIVSRIQASQFGATVLADLQERLHAGDPISALRTFIAKIRDKIVTEGKELTSQQDAQEGKCINDLVEVNSRINVSIVEISVQKGIIAAQHAIARQKEGEITDKETQISKTEAAIALHEQSIINGDALRAENEEEYQAAKLDAEKVAQAVDEILEIEKNSTLYGSQDETIEAKSISVANVADVTSATLIQLQSVSTKVTDETAKSFIQLAALSAQLFGENKGDIDELRALLNQLLAEIDSYVTLLGTENEQSKEDWQTLKSTMETDIGNWKDDLVEFRGELKILKEELAEAIRLKGEAVVAYKSAVTELRAQFGSKKSILKSCSDSKDQYLTQMKSSKEELETLDLIYEIIKDKLADAQDSIAENVDQLMSGGQSAVAQKCHCDHACEVFSDCCPGCKVSDLPQVVSTIAEPEFVGGEKEAPDRDARAVYGTYMDGRAEGFHF